MEKVSIYKDPENTEENPATALYVHYEERLNQLVIESPENPQSPMPPFTLRIPAGRALKPENIASLAKSLNTSYDTFIHKEGRVPDKNDLAKWVSKYFNELHSR
jgi:hypothetical protein